MTDAFDPTGAISSAVLRAQFDPEPEKVVDLRAAMQQALRNIHEHGPAVPYLVISPTSAAAVREHCGLAADAPITRRHLAEFLQDRSIPSIDIKESRT